LETTFPDNALASFTFLCDRIKSPLEEIMPRIDRGSPSGPPLQIDSTDAVESKKPAETKPADQVSADSTAPAAPPPQSPAGKLAEFALSGLARAAQLLTQTPTKDILPTAELLKRNDSQKDPKPETLELQKQVNQWRTANGKKPIKEDGFFGEKTEKAVYEFQKANGLQKDGQAGAATQNRVLLENSPGFKKLDEGIKKETRELMTSYDRDSARLQNLRELMTAPGLSNLSPAHQQMMLNMQRAHPDNPKFTSQLVTLANDPTFGSLDDGMKNRVLNQVSSYASDAGKIDNLTKLVTSPSFDQLATPEQSKMLDELKKRPDDAQLAEGLGKLASSTAFRASNQATKMYVIDALSNNPPLTDEKFNATNGLIGSPQFRRLNDGEKAIVMDGLKAGKADPKYVDSVKTLLDDVKFQTLNAAERTAVLSQVKNYPDPRSVNNIDRLLQKGWFTSQDLADKQRSLKMVAYLSQYDAGDRKVVDNTLEKFLGAKSDYKLEWKEYKDKAGSGTTFGEADEKTLWLNKGIMAADNNKMVVNSNTRHLVLSTTPHEVNHLLNGDKVDSTYKYFEAEYRAWYVGFKAEHGRVPTNQEAMEQRISWQLNPRSFYGEYAAEALKNKKEAAKFYDLLSKMSGQKVDASNWETVIKSDASKWPSAGGPAPVPAGNIDNH
jgi:Putative peptidoglycan binding domain